MKPRTVLTAVATAVFACVGVLVPIAPAAAAGVPPAALSDCNGDSAATGGWLVRDVVATGTTADSPAPVRPRNFRLGEPCFNDEGGLPDPVLAVPVRITDVEIPGILVPGATTNEACTSGGYCVRIIDLAYSRDGTNRWTFCVQSFGGNFPTPQPGPTFGIKIVGGGSSYYTSTELSYNLYAPDTPACNAIPTNNRAYMIWGTGTKPVVADTRISDPALSAYSGRYAVKIPGLFEGTQPAQAVFGANTSFSVPDTGHATCSTDYLGTDTETFDLPGHGHGGSPGISAEPPTVDGEGEATAWTIWQDYFPSGGGTDPGAVLESDCDYLVSLAFWICIYVGTDESEFGCLEVAWTADRFRDRKPYPTTTDDESICALYPNTPGCFDVINPPFVDGTDFDTACAGAPEPTWAVWDWLFPWIGHMVYCLFVPLNGVDRLGWVSSAWENSAGGALTEVAAAVGDALVIDGGCGTLVDVDVQGTPMEIDTCAWTWAEQGRQLLYWFIIVTGCLAAVGFIFRSVLSIVNSRMPVPFSEDKD